MGDGGFQPSLEPVDQPRSFNGSIYGAFFYFSDSLKFRTRTLLGALIQILFCTYLPMKWAIVPAGVMLLNSIITTIIQVLSPAHNSHADGVVPGRSTAQIPSRAGTFGPEPSDKPMVVFNLGVQFNHPLGFLAPGAKAASTYFSKMQADLSARRDELGLMDMSVWRAGERDSNSTLLLTMFFRDVESIHRFAHEPLHRAAWDWHRIEKPAHLGIFHETYCVPAKGYESLYYNCRPVLLGKSQVRTEGKGGEGEVWRGTLVDSRMPALKTQYARLGRREDGAPKERR